MSERFKFGTPVKNSELQKMHTSKSSLIFKAADKLAEGDWLPIDCVDKETLLSTRNLISVRRSVKMQTKAAGLTLYVRRRPVEAK